MKNNKLLIAIFSIVILVGIVLLFTFTNKNKEDEKIDLVGTYIFNRVEKNGNAVSSNEVFGTGSIYGGKLVLNEDKTYTEYVGITGEDDLYTGTYEVESDELVLTNKAGTKQKCTYTKDSISVEDKVYKEGSTLVFKKEKETKDIVKDTLTDYFKGNYGNDINEIKYTDISIVSEEDNKISFEVTYNFILNKGVDPKKYTISGGEVDGLIIKNRKSKGVIKKDVAGNYIIASLGKL